MSTCRAQTKCSSKSATSHTSSMFAARRVSPAAMHAALRACMHADISATLGLAAHIQSHDQQTMLGSCMHAFDSCDARQTRIEIKALLLVFLLFRDRLADSAPKTRLGTALYTAPEIIVCEPNTKYDGEAVRALFLLGCRQPCTTSSACSLYAVLHAWL